MSWEETRMSQNPHSAPAICPPLMSKPKPTKFYLLDAPQPLNTDPSRTTSSWSLVSHPYTVLSHPHYLRGSIDVEHQGVIAGDHAPAPWATPAPPVPHQLQEAAHEALFCIHSRAFLEGREAGKSCRLSIARLRGAFQPIALQLGTLVSLNSGRDGVEWAQHLYVVPQQK